MRVTKALLTAAGTSQRTLPLQTLVDEDGRPKSALEIILGEAIAAGIERVGVVVHPGDEEAFTQAAGVLAAQLTFIPQHQPRGYGHALLCAREFIGDDAFLHMVSDHLAVSGGEVPCARQLVKIAEAQSCSVSAVQATRENRLPYYGVIGGHPEPGSHELYEVEKVREKPTPTQAEQELIVPGLRAGHYLCFFGMHVLTPAIMDLLASRLEEAGPDEWIQLSPALDDLAARERYLAFEIDGHRYNLGMKFGLFFAQLALALHGEDREEMLEQLVEMLATREITRG